MIDLSQLFNSGLPSMSSPPINVFVDPFFSMLTRGGDRHRITLGQLFAAIDADDLTTLTRMQPHQRPDVVTALGIIHAVLRHYSGATGALSAATYSELLINAMGKDAGAVTADWSQPAFLQPPLSAEPTLSKSFEAIGIQFADVGHEIKPVAGSPDLEDWVFALINGQARPYVKDNVSGSRWGLTVALPGNGITIASEIRALSAAYAEAMASDDILDDFPATETAKSRDHFLWLATYSPDHPGLSPIKLAWPWLEAPRATRLIQLDDGSVIARQLTIGKPRVDAKAISGLLRDPQVAYGAEGPFRRLMGRKWDYRFIHSTAFGSHEDVKVAPPIVRVPGYSHLRICSHGTDQGKTKGYREALIPVFAERADEVFFARMTELSKAILARAAATQTYAVYAASMRFFADLSKDHADVMAGQVTADFQQTIEAPSLQVVIDLAHTNPDSAAVVSALGRVIADAATSVLARAEAQVPQSPRRWLDIANGWSYLEWALARHDKLKEFNLMPDDAPPAGDADHVEAGRASEAERPRWQGEIPALARHVYGMLTSFMGIMQGEPQLAATLRTMGGESWSMGYWRLMSKVDDEWLGNHTVMAALDKVVRGLGHIGHHDGASLGTLLAHNDFPEGRVPRLLEASGPALVSMIEEVWRSLLSKGVTTMNWADLAGLVIADALGDEATGNWHRRNIAKAYTRAAAAS